MEPQENAQRKKTLLVDDHPLYLEGIKSILAEHEIIEVTGQAVSAEDALQLFRENSFDFVITDISLPGMNGTELIKEIKKTTPDIPVLVLSMRKGKELVQEILMTEAEGYLLKKAGQQELFQAIDSILDGGTYYSNEIIFLMREIIWAKEEGSLSGEKMLLTVREKEILSLICKEYANKAIADALHITTSTVETHRNHMFKKTGAFNVVGLVRYAVVNNLVEWES